MSDVDLRGALRRLADAGLLADVDAPGEAAAIEAHLGRRVGSRFDAGAGAQIVAFLTPDRRRLACTLGVPETDYLATMLRRLERPMAPFTAAPVAREVDSDLQALRLPAGPKGGPDVAGILVLRDAHRGSEHLALVSLRRETARRLTIHGLPARTLALCRRRAEGGALAIDAALAIGTHPACGIAAALAGAEGQHGWETAGAVADGAIAVAQVDGLAVPAQAELVLRGRLSLDTSAAAATAQQGVSAFDMDALYQCADPILHWMAGGVFRLDADNLHAAAVEIAIARHLANVEGGIDVRDVRCYPETENQVVAVKLRPRVGGQSKTALMAALSSPDLRPRFVIGVDEDIDATSLRDVAWSAASRVHAEIDVATIGGLAMAAAGGVLLDEGTSGAKWVLDSTMPPPTQPERRQSFERAVPKNLDQINLADFLPD